MPSFTSSEVTQLGYIALDFYMKNNPIDQIKVRRPLLKKLLAGKRSFPGGKEYIVEQVRKSYDSNFQWYFGDDNVTYNRRDTVRQAQYEWGGCHDGFSLNEDILLANGITLTDSNSRNPSTNSQADTLQLTNLFKENSEVLSLGFQEKFDYELHLDGTQDSKAIGGLDLLIASDPTTGTVGGIDRSTNTWWRNQASTGIAQASLINTMETQWRACTRNGGAPNFILAGADFIDDFRAAAASVISRYTVQQTSFTTPTEMDPSVKQGEDGTYTGLHFQGVPIVYDPVFADLDANLSPAIAWEKRCYFINTRHMTLRPAAGHDMVNRAPPRNHNAYTFYWAMTWKGALCMNRSNCHAFLSIN